MSKFKAKLRYKIVYETEIEIEASSMISAIDIARLAGKQGDILKHHTFKEIDHTAPTFTSIVEIKGE